MAGLSLIKEQFLCEATSENKEQFLCKATPENKEQFLCEATPETKELKCLLKNRMSLYKIYIRKKIIFENVQKYIIFKDKNSEDGNVKLSEILNNNISSKYYHLDYLNSINLLGVYSENNQLTLKEGNELVFIIKKSIRNQLNHINQEFLNTCKRSIDEEMATKPLTNEILSNFYENLKKSEQQLSKNFLEKFAILEKMLLLRLQEVPGICDKVKREYEITSQINIFKSKIMELKAEKDFFHECPEFFNAFKTFYNEIKKKQKERGAILENLKERDTCYKFVDCAQFQSILKAYLEYKNAIASKKALIAQ